MVFRQYLKIVHGKSLSLHLFLGSTLIIFQNCNQILDHFIILFHFLETFTNDVGLSIQKGVALYFEVNRLGNGAAEFLNLGRLKLPAAIFFSPVIEILLLEQNGCKRRMLLLGSVWIIPISDDILSQTLK